GHNRVRAHLSEDLPMRLPALVFAPLLLLFGAVQAHAEACYVTVDPAQTGPTGVREEYCHQAEGNDDPALEWSCANDQDVQNTQRQKVERCPEGFFGRCVAALTQESLANPESVGRKTEQPFSAPQVPEGAKLVTYHYRALDGGQPKADCEKAGGSWEGVESE